MKSEARRKRAIRIHITTYKTIFCQACKMEEKSCKKCMCNKAHNKYICSICLNQKTDERSNESCKKITKNCPICQKNKECSGKNKERETIGVEKETFRTWANISDGKGKEHCSTRDRTRDYSGNVHERLEAEKDHLVRDPNVKTVQTSGTNVAQGITLLNEVLTVFQNKKVDINKEKVKSGLLKDVAVSTVDKIDEKSLKDKPRLTVSSFQYSIDEKKTTIENGKFTVVNCTQPICLRRLHSIDLPKYKSSSIPQMKMEELKYSLKEKSKSKDAIEEVNRMFATVRKSDETIENSNRPSVRSGPRVLPLVINKADNYKKNLNANQDVHKFCKCCQTCMSSGDYFVNVGCGQDTHKAKKCEKCYYMLSCHYENAHREQTGMLFCEHCRYLDDQCCQHDSSG